LNLRRDGKTVSTFSQAGSAADIDQLTRALALAILREVAKQ
jgi:hypothetical protein